MCISPLLSPPFHPLSVSLPFSVSVSVLLYGISIGIKYKKRAVKRNIFYRFHFDWNQNAKKCVRGHSNTMWHFFLQILDYPPPPMWHLVSFLPPRPPAPGPPNVVWHVSFKKIAFINIFGEWDVLQHLGHTFNLKFEKGLQISGHLCQPPSPHVI